MKILITLAGTAGPLDTKVMPIDPKHVYEEGELGEMITHAVISMISGETLLPGDTITITEEA